MSDEHRGEMLRCIRELDYEAAMRLWQHERPEMPQPDNDYQALVMLHYARSSIASMPEDLRLYSHCWLRDESVPSALPDRLKPKAERLYPIGIRAVGISSQAGPGRAKTAFNRAIESIMSDAVLETYADGHSHQPQIVKARMLELRARFKKQA